MPSAGCDENKIPGGRNRASRLVGHLGERAGNSVWRKQLLNRARAPGFSRHAEYGACRFVLGNSRSSAFLHVRHSIGSIAPHASEQDANDAALGLRNDGHHGNVYRRADKVDFWAGSNVELAIATELGVQLSLSNKNMSFPELIPILCQGHAHARLFLQRIGKGILYELGHVLHQEDAGPQRGHLLKERAENANTTR